jgi:hypothetical protein
MHRTVFPSRDRSLSMGTLSVEYGWSDFCAAERASPFSKRLSAVVWLG